MRYQKPKCDCGEELLFCVDEVITVFYKITQNGEESKRKFDRMPSVSHQAHRLSCPDCNRLYDYSFDEQNRIVRKDYDE